MAGLNWVQVEPVQVQVSFKYVAAGPRPPKRRSCPVLASGYGH